MATVLEDYTTKEQRSLVLNAKDIHEEMFPVYGGKWLSSKPIHNLVDKRGRRFADDEGFERKLQKWLRLQLKTSMVQVSTNW
jgi:hypothetical protein